MENQTDKPATKEEIKAPAPNTIQPNTITEVSPAVVSSTPEQAKPTLVVDNAPVSPSKAH